MEFLTGEENLLYPSSEHTRPRLPNLFARIYSSDILFEKLTLTTNLKSLLAVLHDKFQLQGRR